MTASARCQRWNAGRHSWRHASEGGFDRSRYDVAAIPDDTTAERFVVTHHYTHSYVAALLRFGLYERAALVGVVVLSGGTNRLTLENPLPDLDAYRESAELGRLVLLDRVPANAESYFVARAFELAAAEGLRGVISFSDPLPRTTLDGEIVMPGHVGIVYQALSAAYLGRGTPRSLWETPEGTVIDARSQQKVRAREAGYPEVVAELVRFGARPLEAGEDSRAWLRRAKADARIRVVRHPGNHRYGWRLGARRSRWTFGLPVQPQYPKAVAS